MRRKTYKILLLLTASSHSSSRVEGKQINRLLSLHIGQREWRRVTLTSASRDRHSLWSNLTDRNKREGITHKHTSSSLIQPYKSKTDGSVFILIPRLILIPFIHRLLPDRINMWWYFIPGEKVCGILLVRPWHSEQKLSTDKQVQQSDVWDWVWRNLSLLLPQQHSVHRVRVAMASSFLPK